MKIGARWKRGLARWAVVAGVALSGSARAWDSAGHRTITFLALDGLSELAPDRPGFLGETGSRERVAYQSSLADRYRGLRSGYLRHENEPEHFIDIEDLAGFGLTLETVPRLRSEYLRVMAVAKHEHPEAAKPYNEKLDPVRTQEFPGFGLHAVMEHHAKLIVGFRTLRVLEKLNDPRRAEQMSAERANVEHEMGMLSHFVGDLAQPLHTTKHYNGYVGENPKGYTTAKTFHAYIDGGVIALHSINYEYLKPRVKFDLRVEGGLDCWDEVVGHVRRSYEKVEPLYWLEKTGELNQEAGKAFIAERVGDGARMLAALYASAWESSEITEEDVASFLKYDGFEAERGEIGKKEEGAGGRESGAHEPMEK